MTREKAMAAIRHGVAAGVFVAAATALISVIAMAAGPSDILAYYNDPLFFVDVIIAAALTFGIHRKSRLSALGMVVYFFISKIVQIHDTGLGTNLVSFILLILFLRAFWGTVVYTRIMRQSEPTYGSVRGWVFLLVIPWSVIAVVVVSVGLLITIGIMPDTKVVRGDEMSSYHLGVLQNEGLIAPHDTIMYFYSDAILSVREDGQFFTQDRVVSYWQEDDDLQVFEAHYHEIEDIEFTRAGSWADASIITIILNSEEYFPVLASAEAGGDSLFFRCLRSRWEAAKDSL